VDGDSSSLIRTQSTRDLFPGGSAWVYFHARGRSGCLAGMWCCADLLDQPSSFIRLYRHGLFGHSRTLLKLVPLVATTEASKRILLTCAVPSIDAAKPVGRAKPKRIRFPVYGEVELHFRLTSGGRKSQVRHLEKQHSVKPRRREVLNAHPSLFGDTPATEKLQKGLITGASRQISFYIYPSTSWHDKDKLMRGGSGKIPARKTAGQSVQVANRLWELLRACESLGPDQEVASVPRNSLFHHEILLDFAMDCSGLQCLAISA
jgi:hypothetical protein